VSWTVCPGTVYVVGAGPGDPDLLTVRARRVLEAADVVLYADSLVDPRLLGVVRAGAEVRGTSGMTLEPVAARMIEAAGRGAVVARVHSGDPGVYGAVAEQLALLDRAGIRWEIVPGVPSPMAAAAALGVELTVPGVSQAIVFCRVAGRTPMPPGQDLRALARPGVSLCVFLSTAYAAELVAALRDGGVDAATPAVIAEKVGWPDERLSRGTVGDLERRLRELGVRRHALVLAGPAFAPAAAPPRSALYSREHAHVFRPAQGATGAYRDRAVVAVYALSADGGRVAARICQAVPGARLHLPARLAATVTGAAVAEAAPARATVARLMGECGALVLVMAIGAAVRLAAPHLEDKLRDPSVVAVDDGGRYVVPLAGAHAGGGNALAERIAALLGATAVITTAAELRPWPALDEVARARGWRIENPRALARVMTALLDGAPVGLVQDCGDPLETAGVWPQAMRPLRGLAELRAAGHRAAVVVSDLSTPLEPDWVVLRPPTLAVGVGCEAGVTEAEVARAVDAALAAAAVSSLCLRVVATLDRKTEEPGLVAFCASRGWELQGFAAERLRAVPTPTPSAVVESAVGTPSVCEAAALLGARAGGRLLSCKRVQGRVTVAVARVADGDGHNLEVAAMHSVGPGGD
jgi:precorrin-4 C11-methyltransferase